MPWVADFVSRHDIAYHCGVYKRGIAAYTNEFLFTAVIDNIKQCPLDARQYVIFVSVLSDHTTIHCSPNGTNIVDGTAHDDGSTSRADAIYDILQQWFAVDLHQYLAGQALGP